MFLSTNRQCPGGEPANGEAVRSLRPRTGVPKTWPSLKEKRKNEQRSHRRERKQQALIDGGGGSFGACPAEQIMSHSPKRSIVFFSELGSPPDIPEMAAGRLIRRSPQRAARNTTVPLPGTGTVAAM